jgi:hypothetical protein
MSEADCSYSYKASCAQIVGKSHLGSETPCQDYASARIQHDFACIALADGAGSRLHSAHGARAVVKAVTRALATRFEEMWAQSEASPHEVSNELIVCCRNALERQAKDLGCQISDLASTLALVAHSKGRFLAAHVGDGCIIYQRDDGEIAILSHPDNGEYANTTFFMTDPDVRTRFRLYRGESAQGSGFVIMSDGTAESLYRKADKSPATTAIRKLLSWCSTSAPDAMRAALEKNLQHSFAAKSTDDCSLGVLALAPRGVPKRPEVKAST